MACQMQMLLMMFCITLGPAVSVAIDEHKQLHKDLLTDYDTDVRPVENNTNVLNVSVGVTILSLVKLDEIEQSITLNAQFHFEWIDISLQWDPDLYGGIKETSLKQSSIWVPDIFLTNTLDPRKHLGFSDMKVVVNHQGLVQWLPGDIYKLFCSMDVTLFPFDSQQCFINVSTWTSNLDDISFSVNEANVGMDNLLPNGLWNEIYISFNDDETGLDTLPEARITLGLKRRPVYYILNILIPIFLLSGVNILVFLLPADSGEKMGFSITILLAFVVFLTLLGGMLPMTSLDTPYITVYISTLIALSCLALLATIIVLHFHHQPEARAVPGVLRILVTCTRCCRKSASTNQVVCSSGDVTNQNKIDQKSKGNQDKTVSRDESESGGTVKWSDVSNSLDILFLILFTAASLVCGLIFMVKLTSHL